MSLDCQKMLLYVAAALLAFLATVNCREISKPMKSMPTITNSLVNLGKMDLSFYFSGKSDAPAKNSFFSKPLPMLEMPCPCSSMKNKDSFLSNPSELINRILMSNELFSNNKESLTSTLCCDSHEHIQEDTVLFEFGPTHKTVKNNPARTNPFQLPPFLFDSAIPNKGLLPPFKSKAVEIFLFPKKKDMATFDFTNVMPKRKDVVSRDDIKVVGDKTLRNDFKRLPPPVMSSVKKDLSDPVKKEDKETDKEVTIKINVTDNYPNVL